jgi:hypothetical protein
MTGRTGAGGGTGRRGDGVMYGRVLVCTGARRGVANGELKERYGDELFAAVPGRGVGVGRGATFTRLGVTGDGTGAAAGRPRDGVLVPSGLGVTGVCGLTGREGREPEAQLDGFCLTGEGTTMRGTGATMRGMSEPGRPSGGGGWRKRAVVVRVR